MMAEFFSATDYKARWTPAAHGNSVTKCGP